jgi:hypothetical protein
MRCRGGEEGWPGPGSGVLVTSGTRRCGAKVVARTFNKTSKNLPAIISTPLGRVKPPAPPDLWSFALTAQSVAVWWEWGEYSSRLIPKLAKNKKISIFMLLCVAERFRTALKIVIFCET